MFIRRVRSYTHLRLPLGMLDWSNAGRSNEHEALCAERLNAAYPKGAVGPGFDRSPHRDARVRSPITWQTSTGRW